LNGVMKELNEKSTVEVVVRRLAECLWWEWKLKDAFKSKKVVPRQAPSQWQISLLLWHDLWYPTLPLSPPPNFHSTSIALMPPKDTSWSHLNVSMSMWDERRLVRYVYDWLLRITLHRHEFFRCLSYQKQRSAQISFPVEILTWTHNEGTAAIGTDIVCKR
jgi:hypothetical protein